MQIRKRLSVLLFAWMVCSFLTVTAYAVNVPDISRTGSISLTMTYDGEAVAGGVLTLYQAGEIREEDGNYSFVLTGEFSGCEESLEDLDSSELAYRLEKYASANGLTGIEKKIGSDGTVVFSDLELGLYLVVQTRAAAGYGAAAPFLVSVPMNVDGSYLYDVDAGPKVGLPTETESTAPEPVTPTTPETVLPSSTPAVSTPTPDTPTLPNTGQLNWPIPVLAVLGLCLFSIGWLLRFGKKDSDFC